jgi:hypothetical protein
MERLIGHNRGEIKMLTDREWNMVIKALESKACDIDTSILVNGFNADDERLLKRLSKEYRELANKIHESLFC